ncbi:hypothetical protein ANO11243_020580 [Dothideomycetidae sp. 11243]|nr:hypothetical protein ANO11243_020580 [fungal sp. No.11243]
MLKQLFCSRRSVADERRFSNARGRRRSVAARERWNRLSRCKRGASVVPNMSALARQRGSGVPPSPTHNRILDARAHTHIHACANRQPSDHRRSPVRDRGTHTRALPLEGAGPTVLARDRRSQGKAGGRRQKIATAWSGRHVRHSCVLTSVHPLSLHFARQHSNVLLAANIAPLGHDGDQR